MCWCPPPGSWYSWVTVPSCLTSPGCDMHGALWENLTSWMISTFAGTRHLAIVRKFVMHWRLDPGRSVPSGGLTLILGTQKWGFSCKVQRRPPADILLNESLPPKTPLRTPCSWPPWPWFSREKWLNIFKVLWKIRNFDPHFKNLYLARKWV